MGIQNFNSKEVAQNRSEVKTLFEQILGTKLMLIVIFILAIGLGAILMGYPISYYQVLLGVGVVMTLQSLLVYLRSHFSALGFFTTDSLLSALDKFLMILIIGFFLYVAKEITIMKFIYGQIIALGLAIICTLILLGRKFPLAAKFSFEGSLSLLKKSFPFALVFILMVLFTKMDGVMLERLLDDNAKAAGVYATGYRLMEAANILGYLFSMLLLPMFANKIAEEQDVNPLVKNASALLLTCATIASMVAWFYAEELMYAIYTDISETNIQVFKYLMMGFWFMSMSYIFGSLILAKGETKALNSLLKKFTLTYPMTYIFKVVIFMVLCFVLLYIFSQKLTILWILEAFLAVSILLGVSILFGFFRFNLTNEN